LVVIPSAVEFRCDDNSKPFTATFYNDEPRAAVLTWGNDQAIVPAAPSASGARYAADGVEFWEHQGEAKVDFFGNKLTCKPAA
ncbi:MAG: MliC family protein, partial [Thermomonas sp.]